MQHLQRLSNWHVYRWLLRRIGHNWKALLLLTTIQVILAVSHVATAAVTKQMIDLSVAQSFKAAMLYVLIFAILLIMQLSLGAYLSYKGGMLKETMTHELQKSFMERLYRIEWFTLNKYHNGDIQTRLTSDVTNVVDGWVSTLPMIISLAVQLVTAFLTLWYYDPSLALYAFFLGPVSIALSWFIGRRLKKMQHQIQKAESGYRSVLLENVRHLMTVKTFEYERYSMQQVKEAQRLKLFWVAKRNLFNMTTNLIIGIGYRIGFFLAFVFGAFKLSTGTTTFGTFTAFLQLVGQIQGPMEGLARSLPHVITTITSAERLIEFEQLELEAEKSGNSFSGIDQLPALTFERVSYAYDEQKPILTDIDLTVKPGETIAIIGSSGEGKTTLLRLMLALLAPKSGQMAIVEANGNKTPITSDTRSCFSYVPQGNTLFSGTIADNIRIGHPSATEEQIVVAARSACAWDFIEKLPDGLQTVVGESGAGLSEGQAQRIAIARALVREAPILLLDEATSALDLDTEWDVLHSIKRMSPHKTCIAITHRMSVIDICDRIFRIQDGLLMELAKDDVRIGREHESNTSTAI
ncbi:ABC transporter ATP-binding protein [Paenibacillus sp. YYML68]|uniref:ABC transporter ATP-binding protein n=1 Tax=Paenibacillus sp. YYML68 TaxID=2909250 RepID=UPI0024937745|nr:ABC transporter ATP-binding protein [Paenibacillus sp. YYML68]